MVTIIRSHTKGTYRLGIRRNNKITSSGDQENARMKAVLTNTRISYQANRWAHHNNGLDPRIRHIEIGSRIDKGALQNPTNTLIRIIAIGAAQSK